MTDEITVEKIHTGEFPCNCLRCILNRKKCGKPCGEPGLFRFQIKCFQGSITGGSVCNEYIWKKERYNILRTMDLNSPENIEFHRESQRLFKYLENNNPVDWETASLENTIEGDTLVVKSKGDYSLHEREFKLKYKMKTGSIINAVVETYNSEEKAVALSDYDVNVCREVK